MKQIIVVTSDRDKVENSFVERGFHVVWCSFSVEEIIRIRDCSNVLFLCIADEDEDELKRIALYLRDLCIEEEKILYLYGSQVGVDLVRTRVPAIYVRRAHYRFTSSLGALLDDLSVLKEEADINRPRILLIDDDAAYIGKLRLHLETKFQVYVCHNDIAEAGSMLLSADIVVMGAGGRFTVAEYMELSGAILRRRRSPNFHLYYLASDDAERVRLGGGANSLILSKETDVSRVAAYLAERKAGNYEKNH